MKSHGHVTPNPDGSFARCGGPGLCQTCKDELVLKHAKETDWLLIEHSKALANSRVLIKMLLEERDRLKYEVEFLKTGIRDLACKNI